MTNYNLFPGAAPSVNTFDKGSPVNLGTSFKVTSTAWLTQFRYLSGQGADYSTAIRTGTLWRINASTGSSLGIIVGAYNMPAPTAQNQWVTFDLPTPYQLTPGWLYRVAIRHTNGGYPATTHYFDIGGGTTDYVYGPVVVPSIANVPAGQQGTFKYTSNDTDIPDSTFNAAAYYSDVTITDVNPAVKVNIKAYESGVWTPRSAAPKVYNAGAWVTKPPKRWNGSGWVNL